MTNPAKHRRSEDRQGHGAIAVARQHLIHLLLLTSIALCARADPGDETSIRDCVDMARDTPVELVVPFGPGGGTDSLARVLAEGLRTSLDMQVQVKNRPGAGGLIAARAVTSIAPDRIRIGLLQPRLIIGAMLRGLPTPGLEAFRPLATLTLDPAVWISRDANILAPSRRQPILAASTEVIGRIALPAALIGIDVVPIAGFDGTSDAWLALLRGDLDIVAMSSITARQRLAEHGDIHAIMVLDDENMSDLTGVPSLTTIREARGAFSASKQAIRTDDLAELVAFTTTLARSMDMLLVSAEMDADLQACLTASVGNLLSSSDWQNAARAVGVGVNPKSAAWSQATIDSMRSMFVSNQILVQHLLSYAKR